MIKRALYFCVIGSLLVFIAGCRAPREVRIDLDGNGTVGLRRGQLLKVALKGNATTGYLWSVDMPEEEKGAVLEKKGKDRYVRDSRAIGAGGTRYFRFSAKKRGKTVLKFEYARPWEKNEVPEKTYLLKVVVT